MMGKASGFVKSGCRRGTTASGRRRHRGSSSLRTHWRSCSREATTPRPAESRSGERSPDLRERSPPAGLPKAGRHPAQRGDRKRPVAKGLDIVAGLGQNTLRRRTKGNCGRVGNAGREFTKRGVLQTGVPRRGVCEHRCPVCRGIRAAAVSGRKAPRHRSNRSQKRLRGDFGQLVGVRP